MAASAKRSRRQMARLPFRSLAALSKTASTSRVFNLGVIGQRAKSDPEYARLPMFKSCLNQAIILKHHLRRDEVDLFPDRRQYATKILVPFDWTDLAMGGRSIFFGQEGFRETLTLELGITASELLYDEKILALIDQLPSLDPFLMREHLHRNDIKVAACYFDISKADSQRMQDFVAGELKELIQCASGAGSSNNNSSLARMVSAILSSDVNEKLEPLRKAIGMDPFDFKEGAFSWKGFLYYKWSLEELDQSFVQTLNSLKTLCIVGPVDFRLRKSVDESRQRMVHAIHRERLAVREALKIYDNAFIGLVQRGDARAFREFLLNAPRMFIDIGEKLGVISHICSFWRYRFPPGERPEMTADEADDFFREYDVSLSAGKASEVSWVTAS